MKSIELVLGSRNRKKCKEMAELISPLWEPSRSLERLVIRSVDDFPGSPEVVEDADTFAGNARKKASELARALSVWVVADDSGLTVDALGGAPGVFSARYAGEPTNDEANNRKVVDAARGNYSERPAGPRFAARWRSLIPPERSASRPRVPAAGDSPASPAGRPGSAMIHYF